MHDMAARGDGAATCWLQLSTQCRHPACPGRSLCPEPLPILSGPHLWAARLLFTGSSCGCRSRQLSLQSWPCPVLLTSVSRGPPSPGLPSLNAPLEPSCTSKDLEPSSFHQEASPLPTEAPEEMQPSPTPQLVYQKPLRWEKPPSQEEGSA